MIGKIVFNPDQPKQPQSQQGSGYLQNAQELALAQMRHVAKDESGRLISDLIAALDRNPELRERLRKALMSGNPIANGEGE